MATKNSRVKDLLDRAGRSKIAAPSKSGKAAISSKRSPAAKAKDEDEDDTGTGEGLEAGNQTDDDAGEDEGEGESGDDGEDAGEGDEGESEEDEPKGAKVKAGKPSAKIAKPATIEQLETEFADSPAFAIHCFKKGLTLEQAKAEAYEALKGERAQDQATDKKLKGLGKAGQPGIKVPPRSASVASLGLDANTPPYVVRVHEVMAERTIKDPKTGLERKVTRAEATKIVNTEEPELRRAYIGR